MHSLTASQLTRFNAKSRSLVEGIRVITQAGDLLAFSKHPVDVTVAGVTYKARPGMEISNLANSSGLAVDNAEATAFFLDGVITETDVLNRRFDGAVFFREVFDYAWPGVAPVIFQRGFIGNFLLATPAFKVELRSLTQATSQTTGEVTSPRCRVLVLGDSRCKVNLNGATPNPPLPGSTIPAGLNYRVNPISVQTVGVGGANTSHFTLTMPQAYPNGFFADGVVRWLSGNNAGTSMEVLSYTYSAPTGTFILFEPMTRAIQVGDVLELTAGCNRLYETCLFVYNNLLNRRAEDFLPGQQILVTFVGS